MAGKDIKEIIQIHGEKMLALPGVMGIAEGRYNRKPCIFVFVANKDIEAVNQVPSDIEGYPVVIKQSGEFQALDE